MSRSARRVSVLATWTLVVIGVVWVFYVRPPHDDEYGKWLFISLLSTAMPWVFDSIPVLLIVFSLEERKRPRRVWITAIWTVVVACVAGGQLHPIFQSSAINRRGLAWQVEVFAYPWLFGLLIALWIALWLEKKIAQQTVVAKTDNPAS